jgi:hypothetical protein
VGVGLRWLVGSLGARPVFVVVGALLGGAAGVNQVDRTWKEEALSGAAAGKSGRLLGAAAIILAALSAGVGFLVSGARPAMGASWGIRRPGTRIFLRLPALLGYAAGKPSGVASNGRQGTW